MNIKRGDKFVRIAPSGIYNIGQIVEVTSVRGEWINMKGGVATGISSFFKKWRAIKPVYWENK